VQEKNVKIGNLWISHSFSAWRLGGGFEFAWNSSGRGVAAASAAEWIGRRKNRKKINRFT
jgi:hypothetical protein